MAATRGTLSVPAGSVLALAVVENDPACCISALIMVSSWSTERVVATLGTAANGAVTGRELCVPEGVGGTGGGAEVV